MRFERKFYTQAEAAEKLGVSTGDIYYLVKTERLPVYFYACGELFNVTVQHPDGSIEDLPLAVPIDGVVKSLLPPIDRETLRASLVQIIQLGGRQYRHIPGPKLIADNSPIPTTDDPDKFVENGYTVTGWAEFVDIPASDWIFFADDLFALSETKHEQECTPELFTDTPDAPEIAPQQNQPISAQKGMVKNKPEPQQTFQENEILRVLTELGHDPLHLEAVKAAQRGVKFAVRERLHFSDKVFNKAWERLSKDCRIKRSDIPPKLG